jgi:antirestriction protein
MNRIYVACLASYNNGVLHGEWIDATADVDEMQEHVDRILRASKFPNVMVDHEGEQVPSAEEFAIHDHEGDALKGLGEYSGLAKVAALIELEDLAESEIGSDGPAIVRAYWDNMGTMPDDAQEAVDAARDAYAGSFDNREAFADDYAEQTGLLDSVPENLRSYFDMDAFGRDLLMGDYFENDGHYFHNQ